MKSILLILASSLYLPLCAMDQQQGTPVKALYSKVITADVVMQLIKNDEITILEALLTVGFDPNIKDTDGNTLLHGAAQMGKAESVKLLLKSPVSNVNIQDNDGNTPLHYAMFFNKKACVELLLSHPKIDETIKNTCGDAALDNIPFDYFNLRLITRNFLDEKKKNKAGTYGSK